MSAGGHFILMGVGSLYPRVECTGGHSTLVYSVRGNIVHLDRMSEGTL